MFISQCENLVEICQQRRQKLAKLIDFPVLLWAGDRPCRNFPANQYSFRASSHFLYFAGLPIEKAVILLDEGKLTLFTDDADPNSALWHGEQPSAKKSGEIIGADQVYSLDFLTKFTNNCATIPLTNPATQQQQAGILQRSLLPSNHLTGIDLQLAEAIVQLRLTHDAGAIAQLRQAAKITVEVHRAGQEAVLTAKTEAEVRATMEAVIMAANMTTAYNSIVTVHGEVLHNEQYDHALQPGDLLLADVGAETNFGWAGDVTRTWPVSGKFSATQQLIYDLVLRVHDACIRKVAPGVEYRDIHLQAEYLLAEGLVNLGILRGEVNSVVERHAQALFFPHGVGHLLGLDVHDMEDLGDLAGYAPGRKRSDRPSLKFLRLNRPLQAGMVVTIEPGFYQIPAILNDPIVRKEYADLVNWQELAKFADVRGIRIEDDVLVTANGYEVLTA